jgi:cell wall-associated NlpC family hydrolase
MRVAVGAGRAVIVRIMRASIGRQGAAILVLASLVAGCAHKTPPPHPIAAGHRIAEAAQRMVGVPYRFGGSTPRGFDCSGLAQWAYASADVAIPRTSKEQYRASRGVPRRELALGDLLFFDTDWQQGHVGIYIGGGRFVHAPSSGARVSVAALDAGYYRKRLLRIGRF